MLTFTVLFFIALVVQKVSLQLGILLCIRAGATAALIEPKGNPTVVRSDTKSETVRLKVSDLRQRKSCLMQPPYCVRASNRLLNTTARASSMDIAGVTAPNPPPHGVDSSLEVPSARRISLPTKPIPALTPVQNEDPLDNRLTWPEAVASWRPFGVRRDSREATTMKTEPARAPGSTVAQQALPPRFDRLRGSGTECIGSRRETCAMFPGMREEPKRGVPRFRSMLTPFSDRGQHCRRSLQGCQRTHMYLHAHAHQRRTQAAAHGCEPAVWSHHRLYDAGWERGRTFLRCLSAP